MIPRLPDDDELRVQLEALRDRGLDPLADLVVDLVRDERTRRGYLEQLAVEIPASRAILLRGGLMTFNEVRRALGLPPYFYRLEGEFDDV